MRIHLTGHSYYHVRRLLLRIGRVFGMQCNGKRRAGEYGVEWCQLPFNHDGVCVGWDAQEFKR